MSAALERKLISKLTSAVECARVYDMGLRSNVFEEPINGTIFDWMIDYWRESQMQAAPTWVVMQHEFPSITLDEEVEETTEWLVSRLKDRYVTNRAQDIMLRTAKEIEEDPSRVVARMWHEAFDLVESTSPRTTASDMAANTDERRQRYHHRQEGDGPQGAPIGLPEVDTFTGGILATELAAVAAYTKTGKSFLLAKAAVAAHQQGFVPIVFTLEQPRPEMEDRIDALYSGVSYRRLQRGQLTFEEFRILRETQERLRDTGTLHVQRPPRGERTIKNMCARTRQLGANYLIIDQLSFIDAERSYTGDRAMTAKHGDLVFELKDEISREAAGALPCMMAVQLNRETQRDRANGGRGGLANFANSSMIEQTVDLALGLWRNDEMRANNSMGFDIMGSRRGDKQNWLLRWELQERSVIEVREERDD